MDEGVLAVCTLEQKFCVNSDKDSSKQFSICSQAANERLSTSCSILSTCFNLQYQYNLVIHPHRQRTQYRYWSVASPTTSSAIRTLALDMSMGLTGPTHITATCVLELLRRSKLMDSIATE
jgi:hypothetical protein